MFISFSVFSFMVRERIRSIMQRCAIRAQIGRQKMVTCCSNSLKNFPVQCTNVMNEHLLEYGHVSEFIKTARMRRNMDLTCKGKNIWGLHVRDKSSEPKYTARKYWTDGESRIYMYRKRIERKCMGQKFLVCTGWKYRPISMHGLESKYTVLVIGECAGWKVHCIKPALQSARVQFIVYFMSFVISEINWTNQKLVFG